MRFDPPLNAVEMRIRPDRDRRLTVAGRARVHAVRRDEEIPGNVEVRGREPELAAPRVAADHDSLDLRRPAEQRGRRLELTGVQELPHPARRDALDERHPPHVEAQPREEVEIALAASPEAEGLSCGDRLRSDPAKHLLGELLRRERREPLVEREDENVLDARLRKQLEPAFERGEELDPSAEHRPGMRIERHDARPQPGPARQRRSPGDGPGGRRRRSRRRPNAARRGSPLGSRETFTARNLHAQPRLARAQRLPTEGTRP